MNLIKVPYEVVVKKELDIDLDEIIDYVVEDIRDSDDEVTCYALEFTFGDNVGNYLEKLDLIEDSDVLTKKAIEYIYDEYMKAITKRFPELYDD